MLGNTLAAFALSPIEHIRNSSVNTSGVGADDDVSLFSQEDLDASKAVIMQWPGYKTTPLTKLSALAKSIGIGEIYYKDEGSRFGLGSFKALGGAYAVYKLLKSRKEQASNITVATATDGNHGLSVAWGANTGGCHCVIYIHKEVSKYREQALKLQGAKVIRVEGDYDETVRTCAREAAKNAWVLISDTSFDSGYREIPKTVMAGYTVMVSEIVDQMGPEVPTHLFVQGGVGGLAATICEVLQSVWATAPRFIIVEPELAACLFESARNQVRSSVVLHQETMMAGLSCGEASLVAWPVLSRHVSDFLAIPDSVVAPTMRLLADAPFGDKPIVAGESAVAGLAALIAARKQSPLSDLLGLTSQSRVLVIGTEGATDPEIYQSVVGRAATSVIK